MRDRHGYDGGRNFRTSTFSYLDSRATRPPPFDGPELTDFHAGKSVSLLVEGFQDTVECQLAKTHTFGYDALAGCCYPRLPVVQRPS